MRLLAAEAEAAIIKAEAMSTAMSQANQVTSPCDCLVYANATKNGEVVEAGSLIYTLAPLGWCRRSWPCSRRTRPQG